MAEASERIMSRLRHLADHIAERRFHEATEHHFLPLPIVRPHGTNTMSSHDELAEDARTVWAHWEAIGVTSLMPTIIGLRCFAYGVYLADVEWTFRDADGVEVALVHTSYGFREDAGRFGISAIFSHDEMFQRPVYRQKTAT